MVQALVGEFVAGFRDGWTRFWAVAAWPFRMVEYVTSWMRRARH